MEKLVPFLLKDKPALIQSVFPAQKLSYEAQRERNSGTGQTLTSLGSYWKGRKPLILARAVLLGMLLPSTEEQETNLKIFEMLLGLDEISLAKRCLVANKIRCIDIARVINIDEPSKVFSIYGKFLDGLSLDDLEFPLDSNIEGLELRWNKDLSDNKKLEIIRLYLREIGTYEERASLGKRPEELPEDYLLSHVWVHVSEAYANYGINADSIGELISQFGFLRFGRNAKVGDTFAGGGSIPFEAARMGFESYASDLNPIACMLNWGNANIIGAPELVRGKLKKAQQKLADSFDNAVKDLNIEFDSEGNRAKAYLYCLEVKCPESGWRIPMAPSWVISNSRKAIAILVPNYERKRFDIEIKESVSTSEFRNAHQGTVQGRNLVYSLDGKKYVVPIKTLRGEYRNSNGETVNALRKWECCDISPHPDDILQERLYCIQWIKKESLDKHKKSIFFRGITEEDEQVEQRISDYVHANLASWQKKGWLPDMHIETGKENEGPIRTNGWTYWHHMFTARQLLILATFNRVANNEPLDRIILAKLLDYSNKSSQWRPRGDYPEQLFSGQSMKTMFTWGARSSLSLQDTILTNFSKAEISGDYSVANASADELDESLDLIVTDPPYADAVHYHEITEFFIAWLRQNPPAAFANWTWDSRRPLAIKGTGNDFKKGMVAAYSQMTERMSDNGIQCVMFTHQDSEVWSDMIGIFWAAGLQVINAWYIATETSSERKKGGYVQGTVILILRKRESSHLVGFKQRILPAVRAEVKAQIETMMHLNDRTKEIHGEPIFNDSDLQMAGYAAALKVLTAYTQIGGEDVTSFALRPRKKGEVTVVDEIVQQAAEAANSLLVPDGLSAGTWQKLSGIQRFYIRMMDIETTGASKLDNYQNFAKAFRVVDYSRLMGSMLANKARLKQISEFASRDLGDSAEIGNTWLSILIIGIQQLIKDVEPQVVVNQIRTELPDFFEVRPILIDMLQFIERKAPEQKTRDAAEVLGARLKNMRAIGD